MPYVIQSAITGAFLSPSLHDGQPEWVKLLRDAVPVADLETCAQLIDDHIDIWEQPQVIDLAELYRSIDL